MTLKIGVIGCGAKAVQYISAWAAMENAPSIPAITDPAPAAMSNAAKPIIDSGQKPPTHYKTADELINSAASGLDAIYICTPHAYHFDYTLAALNAGLDVLLEKPMAMNSDEARRLLEAKNESNRTMVIAYQGSLSPLFERVRSLAAKNALGELTAINGVVWENWASAYEGNWKQNIELSGGGFVFDTGSHLLNAVNHLSERRFESVSAKLHSRGRPVDIVGSVRGDLTGGVPVSLTFCGNAIPDCNSALTLFFTEAIVRVDIWGAWLDIQYAQSHERDEFTDDNTKVLESFIDIRNGRMKNPSSPEASVVLAELWDNIQASSDDDGAIVRFDSQ